MRPLLLRLVVLFLSALPLFAQQPGDDVQVLSRKLYAAVTGDEDFATVVGINETVPALEAAGADFIFGRNEPANQNFHTWVKKLTV